MAFLEWIENELYSEEQHFLAVQEKNILHEEMVTDVTADHANPPTPQEKKEAHETRAKYPQLQLYQVLALNCKGEALAMIKALAADSRPPWIQCATNRGIGWSSFSTSTLSENVGHS